MTHPGRGGQDPPADPSAEAALRAVLADAATYYRARLLEHGEPAVGLLRGRGLVDLAADTPAGLRWQFGTPPTAATACSLTSGASATPTR